jgi:choline transporter-like protein 2/4/5
MKQSKDRKCTDCCCCILFFLSCGVMFLIQLAATSLGNPDMLLHGTDYTGATCGMGEMAAKPYTAYPRLGLDLIDHRDTITTAPWNVQLYGLCVEECPAQDVDVTDYICESVPDSSSCKWSSNPLVSYDEPNVWHTAVGTSSLMGRCMPMAIKKTQDFELCAFPDCVEAGKECYTLAFPDEKYWLPATEDERGLCERLVELEVARTSSNPNSGIESEYIGAFFGGISGTMEQLSIAMVEIILIGVVVAMLSNFILLRVLRTCMAVIFVLTLISVLLLLAFVNVFLFAKAGMLDVSAVTSAATDALHALASKVNISQVTEVVVSTTDGVSVQVATNADLFEAVAESDLENFKLAAWISLGVTLLVLLVLLVVAGKLKNALAICAMATKPIAAMPSLLLMPTLAVLLSVVVVVNFFVTTVMFITPDPEAVTLWLESFVGNVTNAMLDVTGASLENLDNNMTGAALDAAASMGVDASAYLASVEDFGHSIDAMQLQLTELPIDAETLVYSAAGFEVFSALWLLFLIDAVTYTTVCGSIGYWYFTGSVEEADLADAADKTKFPILGSLYRCVRFHLGSLAMGSFILTLISVLRAVLAYIDAKTKEMQASNSMVQLVMKCAQLCLFVFDKIIKFLTKFAYVTIATDGASFCQAAVASFKLTLEHPLQMLANEAAMAVLSLLQLIFTPVLCSVLAYNAVEWNWRSHLFEMWGSASSWGQSLCEQYQSDAVDACGYKGTVVGFLESIMTAEPWPSDEKPSSLRVAVATLLVSYWVTRTFRDVYAAAVDTLFICVIKSEDQDVAKAYKKQEMTDTIMYGSSKNLVS